VIRIAVTEAAFDAVAAALALGSVRCEAQLDAQGAAGHLARSVGPRKLTALRGQGESYSDVILRLTELEAQGTALTLC
jgi:hypothetical protein